MQTENEKLYSEQIKTSNNDKWRIYIKKPDDEEMLGVFVELDLTDDLDKTRDANIFFEVWQKKNNKFYNKILD